MINPQYIKLNMTPSGVLPVLHCSQYDVGRPLGFVVHNGTEVVDLDDYTVTIEATRSDDVAITAAVTTDGNIGVFATTATMTNKADRYPAQCVLVDGSSNRVASLPFMMFVVPAAMDENAEAIEEDASLYQQYTTSFSGLIAQIRSEVADNSDAVDVLSSRVDNMIALQTAGSMQGSKVTTFTAQSASQYTSSGDWQSFSFCDASLHLNTTPSMSVLDGLTNPVLISAGAYVLASSSASITDEPIYINLTNDVRFYNHGYLGAAPDKRAVEIAVPKVTDAAGDISGKWLLFVFSVVSDVPVSTSELTDIRVGADGKTYSTAGVAVRTQIENLQSELNGNIESLANIEGYYITSSGTTSANASLRVSDYVEVPEDAIAIEVANSVTVNGRIYHIRPCVVFYNENKVMIGSSNNNTDDIVTEQIPQETKYVRFNQSMTSGDLKYVHFVAFSYTDVTGKWGHYSGAFTARASINTGIPLKANTNYIIKYNSKISGRISNYNSANTSYYKSTTSWIPSVYFPNGNADGNLTIYNSTGELDSLDIDVFTVNSIEEKAQSLPDVYVVDKTNPVYGNYTSLTQCLLDLKDDESEKIIYINGGEYDIHQEYVDANIPVYEGDNPSLDYWDYNVWNPKSTHIIGRGTVKIMWMPNASDITVNQSKTVSPVNVAGSMTLENVEIHCKNGRYCIHDDPLGKTEYINATKKYINVKCYKYANDTGYGFNPVIGFGIDTQMNYEFENCYFKNYGNERAFYMHNRANSVSRVYGGGNIRVNNCILDCGTASMCVKFGNVTSGFRIQVGFYNCHIGGAIHLINEGSATPVLSNTFDLTLLKCGNPTVVVADTNNPYPPTIYN
ncbi:MAG: hypothetical protein IKE23_04180 [Exiguobacterium sp.]|nr:hypothetical protein [Exiguobacterium sp.]